MNLKSIQRISRHTVPKITRASNVGRDYACKEEATFANAHDERKKGHFDQKISAKGENAGLHGRKTIHIQQDSVTLVNRTTVPRRVVRSYAPYPAPKPLCECGKSSGRAR